MVDWTVAILISGLSVATFYAAWHRGLFNKYVARFVLALSGAAGLLAWGSMKALQAWAEGDNYINFFTCGFCRRIPDFSWWGLVLVTVMSIIVMVYTTKPRIDVRSSLRSLWLISAGVSVAIYLFLVHPNETFFYEAAWTSLPKQIQVVEGWTNIIWIMIGHFFLFHAIELLLQCNELNARRRREALRFPILIFGSIPTILTAVFFLWPYIVIACTDAGCAPRRGPNYAMICAQILGLWWPLLVLVGVWVSALASGRAPPSDPKA